MLLILLFSCLLISLQQSKPSVMLTHSSSYFEVMTVEYEGLSQTNGYYMGAVTLGGSSKSFNMIFDTTLALTAWVFSEECSTCKAISKKNSLFKCSSPCKYINNYVDHSTTSTVNGLLESNSFSITSYQATDTVTLAGLTISSIPLYIAESTTATSYPASGAIGLGNSNTNNIMKYFYAQGKIQAKIFAFAFGSQFDVLSFGYQEAYFGMEDYVVLETVNGDIAWAVELTEVQLNNKVNKNLMSTTANVRFDSTLAGYAVPTAVYTELTSAIKTSLGKTPTSSTNGMSVECTSVNDLKKLPSLGFLLGSSSRVFTINSTDYAVYTDNKCEIAIFTDDNLKTWVFGVPFLKSFYVVFDLDNGEVKIATSNTESAETWKQNEDLRLAVIIAGVIVALLSVLVLLLIFKPVPVGTRPESEKEY